MKESMEIERAAGRLAPKEDPMQTPKKPMFDPTINLGHVLTFVGFIVTGSIAYSTLERRVSIVEERQTVATQQGAEKQLEQRDAIREIRQDVKEVQRTLTEITRTLTRTTDRR